ncbi:GNAT family N-acetyltransferase [Paenibacillus sp. RC67]|uniref:GNAT family N-acetyltransferase n=1 Tax=Paenibacillus sp. RC67 TaxID=3039392 RepID=UPI0024AE7767|nr:GNAT family N-acetyltransferase [Paenibacillus sp. RC67]
MTNKLVIIERVPTIEEYTKLCTSVGWRSVMNFDVAHEALNNSLYGVVAIVSDEVVGMGRVVGDGSIYFYIQDIAVMPEYQNNGIGKEIMNSIINYLKTNAPAKAFVGLFAANGTERFYESFKLYRHNELTGLFRVI